MPVATRRIVLVSLLSVLIASVIAPVAQAQSTPRLATLLMDVWPEYDRPATVLVIYRGEFAPGAPVPEMVRLRIPASAGEPSALASARPGEESQPVFQWSDLIALKKATVTRNGDWIEIAFSPLSRVFTLEFYDKLSTVTFDRSYKLTWPGDVAADAVTINVREPFGATNFQATPALPPGVRDDEGLIAHQTNLGGLNAGQALPITLAYRREDKRTSAEALQLATPVPTPQPAAGLPTSTSSPAQWALIVALALGAALITSGVIWYVRTQRQETFRPYQPRKYGDRRGRKSVRTMRTTRPRPAATRLANDEEEKIFCTQCGRQLKADDTFCARCGTRVKGK